MRPRSRANSRSSASSCRPSASVLSAWGMLTSDLRYEVSRTHYRRRRAHHRRRGARHCSPSWSSRPPAGCAPGSTARSSIERSAEMRYGEQIFEIDVPLDGLDWNAADAGRPDRGPLPPPPRGTLHLRLARPGGGVRQCPRRRGRRSVAARRRMRGRRRISGGLRAARRRGRPSSAAGARCRSMRSTTLRARPHACRARDHRGRDHDGGASNSGDTVTVNALGWLDIRLSQPANIPASRVALPNVI